jgi:CPA1 family monovalent cation:H+ antiporter
VWDTLIFLLNGFVFILIGLQLPVIVNGLGNYSIGEAILYGVIISILIIIIRLIWVYPAAHIPRWLFKSIRNSEQKPTWQGIFLIGWSGMRGVVSLASALAIPLTLASNAFPHRNLILFITFVVILITLVLQGLSLKPLIRILKIETNEKETERLQALALRIRLAESVLSYLDTNYPEETQNHDTYKRVRDRFDRMIQITKRNLETDSVNEEGSFLPHYRQMLIELVHIRRRELNYLRHTGEFSEELIREREWELDLEEARLSNKY